jgi:hypothetical protein
MVTTLKHVEKKLYLLDYFQTYLDVKLIFLKGCNIHFKQYFDL